MAGLSGWSPYGSSWLGPHSCHSRVLPWYDPPGLGGSGNLLPSLVPAAGLVRLFFQADSPGFAARTISGKRRVGRLQAQWPVYSLARLWFLIGCAFIFFVIVDHASRNWLRAYMLLTVIIGVGVVLFLMMQVPNINEYPSYAGLAAVGKPILQWLAGFPKYQPPDLLFWRITRAGIAVTCMAILPILSALLSYRNILTRALILGLALALFALIFVSGGVGALVALLAGLWIVCLTNRRLWVWAVFGILLSWIGVYSFLVTPGALEAYLLANWSMRLELWKTALAMIRDFPVTGVGLGVESWFTALPGYATPGLHFGLNYPGSLWIMHAHNYYLQTWVEQGLLGFIALIALIAVGMWLGVYYLKTMKGEQQKLSSAHSGALQLNPYIVWFMPALLCMAA